MIIGLTGFKGSGKDTVAAYLVKKHGFERRAFADPLKKSVAMLLDIPYHEIEKFKNDSTVQVHVGYKNDAIPDDVAPAVNPDHWWSPIRQLTFREFLQRYGTEAHRDVFSEDFWLDATLPEDTSYVGRKIVVTDCRFINEANRIKSVGGHVVRVMRNNNDSNPDFHASEIELLNIHEDLKIYNNGSFDELYDEIENLLVAVSEHAWKPVK